MSSWFSKLGNAVGSFGKKSLSTFNSLGKGASALAHGVLDNEMVQGALATQPELFASINSAVAGGDALLEGTTDFQKWMTPPKPKEEAPPKRGGIEKPGKNPKYDENGSQIIDPKKWRKTNKDQQRWRSKTRYGDGITTGRHRGSGLLSIAPPKPKRSDWSFHSGFNDPNARNQGTVNSVAPAPPKPSRKAVPRYRKNESRAS
jgi:hypothetical protein